ncbi:MAG: peroxiredoxin [Candidatus Marinimicrobia bacterium]|nr:peroxiredoxin [Candidatus Neomarinimicrobiota bacterium]
MKQACGFRDANHQYQELNISVIGVSYDSEISLKNFKQNHDLNFDLLSDTEKVMGTAYGVNKYFFFPSRKTFLIDEKGILIHVFDTVDLNTHPRDIVEFFNNSKKVANHETIH